MTQNHEQPNQSFETPELTAQEATAQRFNDVAATYPEFANFLADVYRAADYASIAVCQEASKQLDDLISPATHKAYWQETADDVIPNVEIPPENKNISRDLANKYGVSERADHYVPLTTNMWTATKAYQRAAVVKAHDAFEQDITVPRVEVGEVSPGEYVAEELLDTYMNAKLDTIEQALSGVPVQSGGNEALHNSLTLNGILAELKDISFDQDIYLGQSSEFAAQKGIYQAAKQAAHDANKQRLSAVVDTLRDDVSYDNIMKTIDAQFGASLQEAARSKQPTFEYETIPRASTEQNLDSHIAELRYAGHTDAEIYRSLMKKHYDPADTSDAGKKLVQDINIKFGK